MLRAIYSFNIYFFLLFRVDASLLLLLYIKRRQLFYTFYRHTRAATRKKQMKINKPLWLVITFSISKHKYWDDLIHKLRWMSRKWGWMYLQLGKGVYRNGSGWTWSHDYIYYQRRTATSCIHNDKRHFEKKIVHVMMKMNESTCVE